MAIGERLARYNTIARFAQNDVLAQQTGAVRLGRYLLTRGDGIPLVQRDRIARFGHGSPYPATHWTVPLRCSSKKAARRANRPGARARTSSKMSAMSSCVSAPFSATI
jgi:hypothetical protein